MTTIAQERAALSKVGRPLRTREQAGFRFTRYDEPRPVTEPAPLVFVHITITNPSNYSSDDAHARAVEAIGISRFPNTGISYNRLLFQSGRAQEGQPVGRRGAHTVNDKDITRCASSGCPHKGGSIPSAATNLNNVVRAYAICQNVDDAVTAVQLDSLARTIAADMLAGCVRRDADVHGHRCVANKDCPAAKMWALMARLVSLINHYVSVGFGGGSPEDDMPTAAEIADAVWAKPTTNAINGAPVTALNLLRYTHGDVARVQDAINAANQALTRLETDMNTVQAAVSRTETVTGQTAAAVSKVGLAVNADGGGVWGTQIADVSTPESGDTSAASTLLTHAAPRAGDFAAAEIQPHLDEIKKTLATLQTAIDALTPEEPPAPLA